MISQYVYYIITISINRDCDMYTNLSGMKRIRRKSFIIASLLQFSKHWGQNFDITQNLQNVDTKIYKAQLHWITVSTLDQREY